MTKRKPPRASISVRLPTETTQHLREVADLAGLAVGQVISVVIAAEIIRGRQAGKQGLAA